jgi:hypothetical protein
MTFLPLVVAAEYAGEFRVHLRFNDGLTKLADLHPLLVGSVFGPIRTPSEFRRFFLDAGTLSWPCGADIAPEALYALPDVSKTPSARVSAESGRS